MSYDKDYQNKYREIHHDRLRDYDHKRYEHNSEQIRKRSCEYRAANLEQTRAVTREWHNLHRKASAEFVQTQKEGKVCALCGEIDVTKLCFHHRDPVTKLFNVGRPGVRSEKLILEEIVKCDVLCGSCHSSLHNEQRRIAAAAAAAAAASW